MPNETDFLNGALGKIGASPISNINDGTPNANWCRTYYVPLRQAWLRSHHWNFAENRIELSASLTPPIFEFAFSYPLPPDELKVKEYNGMNTTYDPSTDTWVVPGRYKIEGRNLFTNDGSVKIVYIRDIDNPNAWDPLFYQFLQTMLGSELANCIAKSASKSAELARIAIGTFLPIASAVDGQEGTVTPYVADDLIRGR